MAQITRELVERPISLATRTSPPIKPTPIKKAPAGVVSIDAASVDDAPSGSILGFPETVNEVSARLVATGVVLLTLAIVVLQQPWLIAVLTYGFVARVLTGPTLSPLGQLVTRVITPALPFEERIVPGPPKRFAQGIGAALSLAAAVAHFAFGATILAYTLVAMITAAASLEAFLGLCLGCKIFAALMRAGVIPEDVCEACNNINLRTAA